MKKKEENIKDVFLVNTGSQSYPVFLDVIERDKMMLPLNIISSELEFLNPALQKQKKREGFLNLYSEDKRKVVNKKFGWFGITLIVLLVLLILIIAYLQIRQTEFVTKDKHDAINYYEIMDIPEGTDYKRLTKEQITKYYRIATKKYHPDLNPNCGEKCVKRMAKINEANTVLVNPKLKKFHDDFGVRPPESMIKMETDKVGGRKKK